MADVNNYQQLLKSSETLVLQCRISLGIGSILIFLGFPLLVAGVMVLLMPLMAIGGVITGSGVLSVCVACCLRCRYKAGFVGWYILTAPAIGGIHPQSPPTIVTRQICHECQRQILPYPLNSYPELENWDTETENVDIEDQRGGATGHVTKDLRPLGPERH